MADNAPGSAPDSPLELGATGWRRTLARGVRKYLRDRCGMMAGSLAFHWFLSLFPALIAVVGITSMAHLGAGTVQRVVTGLNKALPPGAASVFSQALHAADGRTRSGSLVVVIISVAVALWSASTGMTALESGLDVPYDVPADRTFAKKRLMALPLMLVTLGCGGAAAALVVFGGQMEGAVSSFIGWQGTAFVITWTAVRWLLTLVLLALLFSVYYYIGPNRPTPTWRWVSMGGVVATAIFLAASMALSFYVAKFGTFGKMYGAFADVVIVIFWLYLVGVAILIGAELNAQTEREASVQADAQAAEMAAGR